jgi:hypothetical protein
MLNPIAHYEHCGRACGKAVNVGDAACAQSWKDHARAGWAMEDPAYKIEARKAFDGAYTAARAGALRLANY